MNILLTGVGGPTPRCIGRALLNDKQRHFRLIGTDCKARAIGLHDRQLVDRGYLIPPATGAAYWEYITRIVEQENIDFAYIQPEIEVEAWALREAENTAPCLHSAAPYELVVFCRDKSKVSETAYREGFGPAFRSFSGSAIPSFSEMTELLGLPFWVRPVRGASGRGAAKISGESDYSVWIGTVADGSQASFMASEYLPGSNYGCTVLYAEGRLVRALVAERINYVMEGTSITGVTGNTSYGRFFRDERLVELSQELMTAISEETSTVVDGVFTVDYKSDKDGKPQVTEVNVRNVAFSGVATAFGGDLVFDVISARMSAASMNDFVDYSPTTSKYFLRDVDALPVVVDDASVLHQEKCYGRIR